MVPITPRVGVEAPAPRPARRARLHPRPKPRARAPRPPRGGRPLAWATAAPRVARPAPTAGPRTPHLDVWDHLRAQPHMAYGLKYCRLSRRVRKILRNRYRYSKYFFMVPPSKRLIITLHLWKYVLKFYDERTFEERLRALGDNFEPGAPKDEGLLWALFYAQQRLALKHLLGR